MSCCGNKRTAISKPLSPTTPTQPKNPVPNPVVWFRYTGESTLTVIGRVTNTTYQFTHQGATLATDARDYRSLASVPNLQWSGKYRK